MCTQRNFFKLSLGLIFLLSTVIYSNSQPLLNNAHNAQYIVNSDDYWSEEDLKALTDAFRISAEAVKNAASNIATNWDSLAKTYIAAKLISYGAYTAFGAAGAPIFPVACLLVTGMYMAKKSNQEMLYKAWENFRQQPARVQAEIAATAFVQFGLTLKAFGVADQAQRSIVNFARFGWQVSKIPEPLNSVKIAVYKPAGNSVCRVVEAFEDKFQINRYVSDAEQNFFHLDSGLVEKAISTGENLKKLSDHAANIQRNAQIDRIAQYIYKIAIKDKDYKSLDQILKKSGNIDSTFLNTFERFLRTALYENIAGLRESDGPIKKILEGSSDPKHVANLKGGVGEVKVANCQKFFDRSLIDYNKKIKVPLPDENGQLKSTTVSFDFIVQNNLNPNIITALEVKNQKFAQGDDQDFIDQITRQIKAISLHLDLKDVNFEVWSDHPLTEVMKQFLNENNVKYIENYSELLNQFESKQAVYEFRNTPLITQSGEAQTTIHMYTPQASIRVPGVSKPAQLPAPNSIKIAFDQNHVFSALTWQNYAFGVQNNQAKEFVKMPWQTKDKDNFVDNHQNSQQSSGSAQQSNCPSFTFDSNQIQGLMNGLFGKNPLYEHVGSNFHLYDSIPPAAPEQDYSSASKNIDTGFKVLVGSDGGLFISGNLLEMQYGAGALQAGASTSIITAAGVVVIAAIAAYGIYEGVKLLLKPNFNFDTYPYLEQNLTQRSKTGCSDYEKLDIDYHDHQQDHFEDISRIPQTVLENPFFWADGYILPFWLYNKDQIEFHVTGTQDKLKNLGAPVRLDVLPSRKTRSLLISIPKKALKYASCIKDLSKQQIQEKIKTGKQRLVAFSRDVNKFSSYIKDLEQKLVIELVKCKNGVSDYDSENWNQIYKVKEIDDQIQSYYHEIYQNTAEMAFQTVKNGVLQAALQQKSTGS